jgi:hypothetical protein
MDLNQLKKIMDRERAKIIIVENGEPIMVVSRFEDYQQRLLFDKKKERLENTLSRQPKIIQSTKLLTKEEMPADELTVEDLPF